MFARDLTRSLAVLSVSALLVPHADAQPSPPPVPAAPAPSAQPPRAPEPDPGATRDVKHYNLEKDKPAIKGHDPVAYFPEGGGKARKGSAKHAAVHRGVTYWFASDEHARRFKADPDRYEPTYGGWCAYAMAEGKKVDIDPKAFVIDAGRLHLFYTDLISDTRTPWKKRKDELVREADARWKTLSGESARVPNKPPATTPGTPITPGTP